MELVEECVAPGATVRLRGGTGPARSQGPESTMRLMRNWRTGFPDFLYTIVALTAEEDRVMAHFYFSGTHTGVFQFGPRTLSPTGKQINIAEFFLFRVSRDKIVEVIACWDRLQFLEQSGVEP